MLRLVLQNSGLLEKELEVIQVLRYLVGHVVDLVELVENGSLLLLADEPVLSYQLLLSFLTIWRSSSFFSNQRASSSDETIS